MLERCALLVAVAVEQQDFLARARSSDFLAKYDAPDEPEEERARLVARQWEAKYQPLIAAPIAELLRFAAGIGVQVYERAMLETFREASRTFDVVILFAHWKGPEVIADDFSPNVTLAAFAERAAGDASALGRWLAKQFDEALRSSVQPPTPRAILADALVHAPDPLVTRGDIYFSVETDATRLARRRAALDEIFAGLMRPGNRLELWDGMYGREEMEAALGEEFRGTLDLTTCTSTVLADHLSAQRDHVFRSVQFADVQELLWHARCVSIALRLVGERDLSYQDARSLATTILKQAVREAAERNDICRA